jgi:endonuclease YncB( thermonuclease family)
MTTPEIGYTVPVTVSRVIDGDTVEVSIEKKINVRLLDCYMPEVKGASKELGLLAKEYMIRCIENSKEVLLHIPGEDNISHDFTFSRVLGRIYVDGKDLSEIMTEWLESR